MSSSRVPSLTPAQKKAAAAARNPTAIEGLPRTLRDLLTGNRPVPVYWNKGKEEGPEGPAKDERARSVAEQVTGGVPRRSTRKPPKKKQAPAKEVAQRLAAGRSDLKPILVAGLKKAAVHEGKQILFTLEEMTLEELLAPVKSLLNDPILDTAFDEPVMAAFGCWESAMARRQLNGRTGVSHEATLEQETAQLLNALVDFFAFHKGKPVALENQVPIAYNDGGNIRRGRLDLGAAVGSTRDTLLAPVIEAKSRQVTEPLLTSMRPSPGLRFFLVDDETLAFGTPKKPDGLEAHTKPDIASTEWRWESSSATRAYVRALQPLGYGLAADVRSGALWDGQDYVATLGSTSGPFSVKMRHVPASDLEVNLGRRRPARPNRKSGKPHAAESSIASSHSVRRSNRIVEQNLNLSCDDDAPPLHRPPNFWAYCIALLLQEFRDEKIERYPGFPNTF